MAAAAAVAAAAYRGPCLRSQPASSRDFVRRGSLCSCSPAPPLPTLRGLVGTVISRGNPGAKSSARGSASASPPLPCSPLPAGPRLRRGPPSAAAGRPPFPLPAAAAAAETTTRSQHRCSTPPLSSHGHLAANVFWSGFQSYSDSCGIKSLELV